MSEKRSWPGSRLVAAVPPGHRHGGVEWLAIQHDGADRCGYYLFRHHRLNQPSSAESWHQTLNTALQEAEARWGVGAGCWTIE
jgi:hypothetical protein